MSKLFYLAALCVVLSGCAQKTGKDRKNSRQKKSMEATMAGDIPLLIVIPVALGFLAFSVANAHPIHKDEEI